MKNLERCVTCSFHITNRDAQNQFAMYFCQGHAEASLSEPFFCIDCIKLPLGVFTRQTCLAWSPDLLVLLESLQVDGMFLAKSKPPLVSLLWLTLSRYAWVSRTSSCLPTIKSCGTCVLLLPNGPQQGRNHDRCTQGCYGWAILQYHRWRNQFLGTCSPLLRGRSCSFSYNRVSYMRFPALPLLQQVMDMVRESKAQVILVA